MQEDDSVHKFHLYDEKLLRMVASHIIIFIKAVGEAD